MQSLSLENTKFRYRFEPTPYILFAHRRDSVGTNGSRSRSDAGRLVKKLCLTTSLRGFEFRLVAARPRSDHRLDRLNQSRWIDRFIQMNLKSGLLCLQSILRSCERGQGNDRHILCQLILKSPNVTKNRVTVHLGHHQITQHDVGMISLDRLNRFLARLYRDYPGAALFKNLIYKSTSVRVVINDDHRNILQGSH